MGKVCQVFRAAQTPMVFHDAFLCLYFFNRAAGYIGGFNVGDEYLGVTKRYGPWRDAHLRIEGDALDQMRSKALSGKHGQWLRLSS